MSVPPHAASSALAESAAPASTAEAADESTGGAVAAASTRMVAELTGGVAPVEVVSFAHAALVMTAAQNNVEPIREITGRAYPSR